MNNKTTDKSNLTCPSCKSNDISTGYKNRVEEKDSLICNNCRYSQFARVFIREYKIQLSKSEKGYL